MGRQMAEREKTATIDSKVRMKEPLRARIEAAARDRGISMNAEAVDRLEQSFRSESLLPQILDLAHGEQTAGLLMLLGRCIHEVSTQAASMERPTAEPAEGWMKLPWTYHQVEEAVQHILHALRPAEEPTPPEMLSAEGLRDRERFVLSNLGQARTSVIVAATIDPTTHDWLGRLMRPVRERLIQVIESLPADHPAR